MNRRFLPALRPASVLVICTWMIVLPACSSGGASQGKLANGAVVPAGASFSPPVPTSKMPLDVLGQIGSSGVRGVFRAELVVSETGTVSEVRVTNSLGDSVSHVLLPLLSQLTFTPAVLDGKPVAAIYTATYNFTSK